MNTQTRYVRTCVAIALLCSSGTMAAQADPVYTLLARGWSALADAQPAAAVTTADQVLSLSPRSHEGITLKVTALATTDPRRAIDAYEQWTASAGRDDAFVMEPIARGVLLDIATKSASDPALRFEALETLARIGDAPARAQIEATLTSEPSSLAAAASGAAIGSPRSISTLRRLAESPDIRDKSAILRALAHSKDPAAATIVMPLLKDPSPITRAAAIDALAALRATSALAALREALGDSASSVGMAAAVALHVLGDSSGDAMLRTMLASDIADFKLLAAAAYENDPPGAWVEVIRPLLRDPDGLTRFKAAELLAKVDPEAARGVASAGLADANPNIRGEAARVFAIELPSDLPALRRLLRDASAWVRLHAARGVFKATGAIG